MTRFAPGALVIGLTDNRWVTYGPGDDVERVRLAVEKVWAGRAPWVAVVGSNGVSVQVFTDEIVSVKVC